MQGEAIMHVVDDDRAFGNNLGALVLPSLDRTKEREVLIDDHRRHRADG